MGSCIGHKASIAPKYYTCELKCWFLYFVVRIPAIIKEKKVTVKKNTNINKWVLSICSPKSFIHIHKDTDTHAELQIECQY